MSENSSVDRAEMLKAAGQIDDSQNRILSGQRTLSGNVNDLMAGWQGQAASAFLSAFQEFDGQFNKVHQALVGIHEELTQTQKTYTQTEEDQRAASNAIFQALN